MFSPANAAQLAKEMFEGRLGIAVFIFVDVFLLANLSFGYLGQVWAVNDGERQEG